MAHPYQQRLVAITVSVALAIAPLQVNANWMEDFYGSAGAAANVTAPSAIMTQNVVGFSGGGVTWRVPNRTLNPIQITPPSLKMGCGGIDAYLGGFSFVNKDAFVNALRNFGQAAVGYFFNLALHSIAPEIAITLDGINDIAQKINQFGANSCQMAKLAVDSVAGQFFEENKRDASAYAQNVGAVVDWFDSNLYHNTEGGSKVYENAYMAKYGKSQSALTRADVCNNKGVDVNMINWMICHSKINLTDDETELAMSMIGADHIIAAQTDSDGKTMPEANGHGWTVNFEDLVGAPGEATRTLTMLRCNNVECTQINKVAQDHRTFTAIVEGTLSKLQTHIVARTQTVLNAEEQSVIKLSSIPLYRAASLSVTGGFMQEAAVSMSHDLAQYAALDAANNFIRFYLDQVVRAIQTSRARLPAGLEPKADAVIARIAEIKRDAAQVQRQIYEKRGDPWQKIQQLQEIEKGMISKMNIHLAANQRFMHRN